MEGVFYTGESVSRCGYCKGEHCSVSNGMHVFDLCNQDYQELIDRGWRRCGRYCYKPDNKRTCCPSYTIRCNALEFQLTKSHKRLLRRMNNFLRNGAKVTLDVKDSEETSNSAEHEPAIDERPVISDILMENINIEHAVLVNAQARQPISKPTPKAQASPDADMSCLAAKEPVLIEPKDLPKPKKAKQLRLERMQAKLAARGIAPATPATRPNNKEKTLAEYIAESEAVKDVKHKLKVVLLAVRSAEFNNLRAGSFKLYQKYQSIVHNVPDETYAGYDGFLQEGPLKLENAAESHDVVYGAYHQQYYLDDKLIAVGVIDILPKCVSSVYFFYDPDYSFLSLGTYASLREIAFVQELAQKVPELKYYYMGFYIHSCPKMRYKGKLSPSYLLCSEAYTWHLLTPAILAKLDAHKYQRFNDELDAKDPEPFSAADLQLVPVMMSSKQSKNYYQTLAREATNIQEYGNLVGASIAKRLFYYIN